jgi:hypothetical protein
MRIDKKNKKIRNLQSEITGSMLFSRNAPASRPQDSLLAEKEITKVEGKRFFPLANLPVIVT